jgi:hypothetical protein
MNSQENIISKTKWIEDLRKNASQYKAEEFNLSQSYLQNDFHLNKIYKKLLVDDINTEYRNFNSLQKQLKFYINEAYSYLVGKRISKTENYEFQNKINKIDNLLHKIRNDYKTKFDSLLTEEAALQQELDNYDMTFMNEFSKEQENKLREYYNNRLNQDEDIEMLNKMSQNQNMKNYSLLNIGNTKNHPKSASANIGTVGENDGGQVCNLDIIDKYIDKIMTNANYSVYGLDEEEITYNDVEKLIKKMNKNHLNIIRIKTDIINSIIEKKLGGNNQGWEPKEHEEFLKLKISHNNRINTYEFLTSLSTTIPYIPVSELKNHIHLYEKYLKINDIKKLLLQKYKDIKKQADEEEKEKKIQKLKQDKINRELQKKEMANKHKIQEERRQKVYEWKQNKEREFYENRQKMMEEQKMQRQKERETYYMNKQRNQYMLEDYYRRKEEEEQKRKMIEEEEKKKRGLSINKFDIDRIKEKEDALLEKKIVAKRVKSTKGLSKEIMYQNYKMKEKEKMKYIPSKYKELTTQSKNRKREKFDPKKEKGRDACTMANNVLGRTSRAIPLWRQGIK